MATIRKRGSKWQVQVRRGGFAAQSRSFSQQRDAERWGILKERELDLLESQGRVGVIVCDIRYTHLKARSLVERLDQVENSSIPLETS